MPEAALAHLHFSPDLESLALRLHERLTQERRRLGPFETTTILVPNRNVRRWLSMRLADLDGVSASIDFLYLEQGLIRALKGGRPSEVSLAGQTDVELELCSILCEPGLEEPLASYVRGGPAARTRQLAARLASLFREYEYHREHWIDSWLSADAPFESPMLRAQARIYKQLTSRLRARGLSTFYGYSAALMKGDAPEGSRVFVFGISQISTLHARILFYLAQSTGFDLYLADFVLSARAPEAWTEVNPVSHLEEGPVLDWLRPQRELIEILKRYATNSAWYAMRPPRKEGTPAFLADSVLDAAAGRKSRKPGSLPPLEVVGAPGAFREVEAVYCDILGRLKSDPTLKLTDIAVLVPDMSSYRTWIESVFEREPPGLPYNLTDFTSAGSSLYAQGVEYLMDLVVEPDFRRSQIAALFRNTCFQAAMGFDDKQAVEWLRVIDLTGAYRGLGHNDPFTFSAALRRLRFSYVFSPSEEETYEGVVPRGDPFLSAESAGLLSSVFEKLAESVEQLRSLPESELAQGMGSFLHTFLRVPRNLREEARIEEGLFSFLDRLQSCGLLFPLAMCVELVRAETGGAAGSKGEYLAGGVTVAQLQPMRPIPFRITYVLGMEEGSFPGRADESTMNLRALAPEPNDVSLPETNRLLFLESLFGAREHLVISYVCRDPARDAEYEPCSVVQELVSFARTRGVDVVQRRLPPHLSLPDQPLRSVYIPQAEASLMHLRAGVTVPPNVAPRHHDRPVLAPGGGVLSRISLKMLTDYLKRPLDAVLKYIVRVPSESREDNALKDIEPFYSGDYLSRAVPDAIVADMLGRGVYTEEALRASGARVYGSHVRKMELPPGAFGEADLARILERLLDCLDRWQAGLTAGPYVPKQFELKLADEQGAVTIDAHFPLTFESNSFIELVERTSSAANAEAGLASFLFATALRAAGEKRSIRRRILENTRTSVFEIPPISAADASRYLLMISRDLISANETFIPLKLVMGPGLAEFKGTPLEFVEKVEEALADENQVYSYSEFFSTLPLRLDENALELARSRFTLFAASKPQQRGRK